MTDTALVVTAPEASRVAGKIIVLPPWAIFRTDDEGQPIVNGQSLYVFVSADVFYPAILAEYAERYSSPNKLPGYMLDSEGKPKKEWADALADLHSDRPGAYWCEVAFNTMKMDLQAACGTFALNIIVKDATKEYAQATRKHGRDVKLAYQGREARQHYRTLRGSIPR